MVRQNGFALGVAELCYGCEDPETALTSTNGQTSIKFGDILEFDDIRIGVKNFDVNFDTPEPFSGSIFVASGGAKFLPGRPVSATLTDRQSPDDKNSDGSDNTEAILLQLTFSGGRVDSFQFEVDTLTVQISSFVTLSAVGFTIDTGAGDNEELVSFVSVGATVKIGSMEISGEARNFAFLGDGTFVTKPGFGVFLSIGSATGDSFAWPSFMPIKITAIGIEWADIQNDPADFVLTLSASVDAIEGIDGLEFSGSIEGIKIAPKLLAQGRFPIIDIASIGVSVKGNLFGGEIDAQLIGGIIKLDENFNIIGPLDSSTPVAKRVFFIGVQGGFSMAGLGGLTIRFAMSELGPLSVFINAELPSGIILVPQIGLAINDFSAGVEFYKSLPSIEDPFALRGPEFGLPTELSPEQWLASVKDQVAIQARLLAENPNLNGFTAAFTSPMIITGGAKLYSIYTSKEAFNGQVTIKISTDGKFLIVGQLNFASDNISVSGKLYADLSNVTAGEVTVLFLADIPDQIRLLTVHGKLKTGFRNASGEEVMFDVVDELPATPTSDQQPAAALIDPVQDGGSIDQTTANSEDRKVDGKRYVDVNYRAPSGAELDYASILDDDDEFVASLNGGPDLPVDGRPTPMETIITDIGPITVPLVLEDINGTRSVTRFGPSREVLVQQEGAYENFTDAQLLDQARTDFGDRLGLAVEDIQVEVVDGNDVLVRTIRAATALKKEVLVEKTDGLSGATDDELLIAAIRRSGSGRFRYVIEDAGFDFEKGEMVLTFAPGTFKTVDVILEDGNVVPGTENGDVALRFFIEGATAILADPGAGANIDINSLNDRNYIDVVFVTPTDPENLTIDAGSITDFEPEFRLTGPGIGSVTLDSSRPPVLLDAAGEPKTYRYWLSGKFADTGDVTLTFLDDAWSFNIAETPPPAIIPDPTATAGATKTVLLVDAGVAVNDIWTITLDDVKYSYAAGGSDTMSDIATELARRIDASVTFLASSEDETLVITKVGGGDFSIETTTSGDGTATIGDATGATKAVILTGSVSSGQTWGIDAKVGPAAPATLASVTATGDDDLNSIAGQLAQAIDAEAGYSARADGAAVVITMLAAISDPADFTVTPRAPPEATASASDNVLEPVIGITLSGDGTAAVDWTVTLDGTDVTVTGGSGLAVITSDLADAVDDATDYIAVAQGHTLFIRRVDGDTFPVSTTLPLGGFADLTDVSFEAQKVTLGGQVADAQLWEIEVDGATASYTASTGDAIAEVAEGLAGDITQSITGFVALAVDNTVIIAAITDRFVSLTANVPAAGGSIIASATTSAASVPVRLGDPEQFVTVVFPDGPIDLGVVEGDEIEIVSVVVPGTNGDADWTVELDPVALPLEVTPNIYRYKLIIDPGSSELSTVMVQYAFVDESFNLDGAPYDLDAGSNSDINDPEENPKVIQRFTLGESAPSTIRVTMPDAPDTYPDAFALDPATVLDAGAEFDDADGVAENGVQLANSGNWIITLDPFRDVVQVGSSNVFDFPITVDFPEGEDPTPSVTVTIEFDETAFAYTGPTSGGTQGGDTEEQINPGSTNNRTFMDVAFFPSTGSELEEPLIEDPENEFIIGGFGGSAVTFSDDPHNLINLGGGRFRYLLEGDFTAGDVEIHFIADQWGNGILNRAFTQTFTVQGTTADLIKRIMVPVLDENGDPTGDEEETIVALNGRGIGQDTINENGYLEVVFRPSGENSIEASSINGDELEVRDSEGNLVPLDPQPQRVGLSDTYRYLFTAALEPGPYTVDIMPGSIFDTAGVVNQPETETFIVEQAVAALADPMDGDVVKREDLNSRGYVDVTFNPVQTFANDGTVLTESAVDPDSILDRAPEITISGSGDDDIVVDGQPIRLDGSDTYRYFFTGKYSDGAITVEFISGSWQDADGNPIQQEQIDVTDAGQVDIPDPIRGRPFIDVSFDPTNGSTVDADTIDGDEFTLMGADGENLVFDQVLQVDETTFRYLYRGQVDTGPMTVTFVAGAWSDTEGNDGAAGTGTINVISSAQVFFIELSGGIILQAADLFDEPLLEVKASAVFEADFERKVFTLAFSGQLKVIKLGTVGATAGLFVLDTSNTLSDLPQFWGVATLETNFEGLEQFGIFLYAKGTLQVNTTEFTKIETLTLPGIGPNGSDATRVFELPPLSFSLELAGLLRLRPPGTDTDLVRMQGGFYLSINPERFEIFATAELSFGVGDAQLTYGEATGLIVIVTGLGAGQNPGVAGYLSVRAGASLGLPDVGDLFKLSGSVTVMFNTTLKDQIFNIPDAFLPLLDEGDPTTIEIFASAPSLDGQRNPRAPPGGEVYVQASIQAELSIGGVITLIGFVQIEVAVGADGARLEVTGAVSTKIAFLGSLTGTVNLAIFIGPRTGIVGRVFLALSSNDIPGININGVFLLEINTFTEVDAVERTIETFKIKEKTLFAGTAKERIVFDGFERDEAGNLVVVAEQVGVVGGFRLVLGGELNIADILVIQAEVKFRLELAGDNPGIELILNGMMKLGPLGEVRLVDSGFRINGDGLVARLDLQIEGGFGGDVGLAFDVSALLTLNTTGRVQSLGSSTVDPGFRLRLEGSVTFLGFAKAQGMVDIIIAQDIFQLEFAVSFNLGGLVFEASGGAAIVGGDDPGFVLKLNVRAVADIDVFYIEASGRFELNTTNTQRLGVAGNSFLLELSGKVEILKVLKMDATFRVEVQDNEWSFMLSASIDFFGIVKLDGSLYLDSKGNFDLQLRGRMVLGSSSFGLIGEFHFRVRSEVLSDAIGNPYFIFELSGGASVKAKVFGITLAGLSLDFSFRAEGNGRVPIVLSITVKVKILFVKVKKTARFKVGVLELPKPVFLGGQAGDPRGWNPDTGGPLHLNVGDRKGDRNIAVDDNDEPFIIEQLGGAGGKALIKVTAFGRSNIFDNVTNIVADFGPGNDSFRVLSGVTVPVSVRGGSGQDVLIYEGSGAADIFGDGGSDYIEINGPADVFVAGGNESSTPDDPKGDYIVHTGTGTAVIDGGNGDDRIFGGTENDILVGNGGHDDITGPAAEVYGDYPRAGLGISNSGSSGDDLVTLTVDDPAAIVDMGGNTSAEGDTLELFGRPEGDRFEIKPVGGQAGRVDIVVATAAAPGNTEVRAVSGLEHLEIDGRGGADTFTVRDMENAGLRSFVISMGRRYTVNGTRIIVEDIDGKKFNREVPNAVAFDDNAADSVLIEGDDGIDEFELRAAVADPDSGFFTEVGVARTTGGTTYEVIIGQSIRAEGDALTVDAKAGDDVMDAARLGYADPEEGTRQTDQIALTLIGGSGDDRLIGTPFEDVLDSGTGSDTVTGGESRDIFLDASLPGSGDVDTLVERFDADITLTDSTLITGEILGDGRVQIITVTDGIQAGPEIQRVQHSATGGTFKLIFDGEATDDIAYNAPAAVVEFRLQSLPDIADVAVTRTGDGSEKRPYTWTIAFIDALNSGGDPIDVPALEVDAADLTPVNAQATVAVIEDAVTLDDDIPEVQRITHSGAGGSFELFFDILPDDTISVPYNATAGQLDALLESLEAMGHVQVTRVTTTPYTWEITFFTEDNEPARMPQLRAEDGSLQPGGLIGNSPTEAELDQTFNEDDPIMRLLDTADRYRAGAIVEDLKSIFEVAEISGGGGRNILVIGDVDGSVGVGNAQIPVSDWTGKATLDNRGNATLDETGFLNELYIINLVGIGGTQVAVRDSGEGSGTDEIIVNDTNESDVITLNAVGSGENRTGAAVFDSASAPSVDIVTFRAIERVTLNALGGDDRLISNDTAAVTVVNLGGGDDAIVIGTVPLIPDTGNRTLEFPEGVPVVDTENLTNGNSNFLYILGEDQNDEFEVNFNRAQLFLHGGSGDDRFLLKTFLVLKENADNPDETTNLSNVFGGTGSNRYSYLENGPVKINGGPGIDSLVIVGTPIGDTFVITETAVAGAGRLVSFRGIEALEIFGAGGADHIYLLSTSELFTTTINGGSGDDVIHLGGDHPPLVFDPPEFTYQPPAIQVELPPTLEFVQEVKRFGNFTFEFRLGFWESIISTFIGANSFVEQAQRAVERTIHGWFDTWKLNIPNFRNPTLEFAISSATEYTKRFLGIVISRKIRVRVRWPTNGVSWYRAPPRSSQSRSPWIRRPLPINNRPSSP